MRRHSVTLCFCLILLTSAVTLQGCPPEDRDYSLDNWFPRAKDNAWEFLVYKINETDGRKDWAFDELGRTAESNVGLRVWWRVLEDREDVANSPDYKGVDTWKMAQELNYQGQTAEEWNTTFYFVLLGREPSEDKSRRLGGNGILYQMTADDYASVDRAKMEYYSKRLATRNEAPPEHLFARWERQNMRNGYEYASNAWWRYVSSVDAQKLFDPAWDSDYSIGTWRGVPLDALYTYITTEAFVNLQLPGYSQSWQFLLGDLMFTATGGLSAVPGLRTDFSTRGDFDYQAYNLWREGVGPVIFDADLSTDFFPAAFPTAELGVVFPQRVFFALASTDLEAGKGTKAIYTYDGQPMLVHLGQNQQSVLELTPMLTPSERAVVRAVDFTNWSNPGLSTILGAHWAFGDGADLLLEDPEDDVLAPVSHDYSDPLDVEAGLALEPGLYSPSLGLVSVLGSDSTGLLQKEVNLGLLPEAQQDAIQALFPAAEQVTLLGDYVQLMDDNLMPVEDYLAATPMPDIKAAYLEVTELPVPAFEVSSASLNGSVAPRDVVFTNQSDARNEYPAPQSGPRHPITEWRWDFDNDGEYDGTDEDGNWTYNEPGCYTAVLEIWNEVCDANNSGTPDHGEWQVAQENNIEVVELPTIDFSWASAEPPQTIAPRTVQFVNESTANAEGTCGDHELSFRWDFDGDGEFDSEEESPSHTYGEAGCYNPTLGMWNDVLDLDADGEADEDEWVYLTTNGLEVVTEPVAGFEIDATTPSQRVAPRTVTFHNLSTTDDTATFCTTHTVGYAWDFDGDGIVDSTDFAPTFTYADPGCYTVTLTVTNDIGAAVSTQPGVVEVVSAPQADFSIEATTPDQRVAPRSVTFTNLSTTNAQATFCTEHTLTYEWDFDGDGVVDSNDFEPTFSYDIVGCYTVSLRVVNDIGEAVSEKEALVEVTELPTAEFTTDVTSGQAPLTVTFDLVDVPNNVGTCDPHPITLWEWDFDGDEVVDLTSDTFQAQVQHTYAPGCYNPTLRVTSDTGSSVISNPESIEVWLPPQAVIGVPETTPPQRIAPRTVQFDNLSTTSEQATFCTEHSVSYEWDLDGDGTPDSTDFEPSFTYAAPGCYTVSLTVTNDLGSDTTTVDVEVVLAPTASFVVPDTTSDERVAPRTVEPVNESTTDVDAEFCTGHPISYAWDFDGDGTTDSTARDPQFVYSVPGCYVASLTVSNDIGTATYTQSVEVTDVPVASIAIQETDPGNRIAPCFIHFVNNSTTTVTFCDTYDATYAWDFNNDGTPDSSEFEPSCPFGDPGCYLVALTVTNAMGSDTDTLLVEIVEAPVASFSFPATTPDERVAPRTVDFTNESTVNADTEFCTTHPVTYAWDFDGDGVTDSTEFEPSYTYTIPGCYVASLTVTSDIGSDTYFDQIEATTLPVAYFEAYVNMGPAPLLVDFHDFSAGSSGCVAYPITEWLWDFGDGETSTDQDPVHTYDDPGCYTVTLTITNSVGSDSITYTNFIDVGQLPAPDFTATNTGPHVMQFTDMTDPLDGACCVPHPVVAWWWDFSGFGTSMEQNPEFTFPAAGTYSVALIVITDMGPNIAVKDVDVP